MLTVKQSLCIVFALICQSSRPSFAFYHIHCQDAPCFGASFGVCWGTAYVVSLGMRAFAAFLAGLDACVSPYLFSFLSSFLLSYLCFPYSANFTPLNHFLM